MRSWLEAVGDGLLLLRLLLGYFLLLSTLIIEGDRRLLGIQGVDMNQEPLQVESLRRLAICVPPLLLIVEVQYVISSNIVDKLADHRVHWLVKNRPRWV